MKLLARKAKLGAVLTEDQRRAMMDLQSLLGSSRVSFTDGGLSVLGALSGSSTNLRQPRAEAASVKVEVARGVELTAAASVARSEVRKLEKKVRECELLERRVAQGEILEANQRAKLERKTEWQQQVAAMWGED